MLALSLLLLTTLESDSGWEDAIWRYSSAAKTIAWVSLAGMLLAAIAGFFFAERLRSGRGHNTRRFLATSLTVALVALAAWIAALYAAPS